jgi:hypothetical protein
MNFDPCNCPLKIQESIKTPIPKVGTHLGMEVHSFTLSYIPRNMKCDSRASLLAHTFASFCLGCKAKAKVATSLWNMDFTKLLNRKFLLRGDESCGWTCHFWSTLTFFLHRKKSLCGLKFWCQSIFQHGYLSMIVHF